MTEEYAPDQGECNAEFDTELLNSIPNGTIFAYNVDERNAPGGMKVRWKIRVATGGEVARVDARQAEAIKEALIWVHRYLPHLTR